MGAMTKFPSRTKSFTPDEDVGEHSNPLTKLVGNSDYDEYRYFDPLGYRGKPKNDLDEIDNEVSELVDEAAKAVEGASDPYAAMIKTLSTGDTFVPIFTSGEVRISVIQDKPVSTMLSRNAVDTKTQRYNELVTVDNATSFAEEGSIKDSNDDIQKHEYTIDRGYGRKYSVTDLMMLAGDELSPRSVKEEAIVESIDRYEEQQGLNGTNNDADGFEGIRDWANANGVTDTYSGEVDQNVLREVYNELDKRGVDPSDMMIVVNHDLHKQLRNKIDDRIRFDPLDELSDGFETLVFDNAPVMKSHGADDGAIYAFDASSTRWNMLADTEIKALPVGDTTRNWALYRYGQLVTQKQVGTVVYDPAP